MHTHKEFASPKLPRVWSIEVMFLLQTQEGYPLVDSSGQPTKKVHTYGAHWAEQIGDGYEAETFSNSKSGPHSPIDPNRNYVSDHVN